MNLQERQKNRSLYFDELVRSSQKYFVPYVSKYKKIEHGLNILEIGCGEGGNLLPFSEMGCKAIGVDLAADKIKNAQFFFQERNASGEFIASDIFEMKELEHQFDLIFCHDVIEHIENKDEFLSRMKKYLNSDGIIFMGFPAWQMPFGGHQQVCKNKVVSHLPFIHLLPRPIYKEILKAGGETEGCIKELLEIKTTRTPIELFEKLVKRHKISIVNKEFYFINPHYEAKFGLKPRKVMPIFRSIPYLRNFYTTSCFYILKA